MNKGKSAFEDLTSFRRLLRSLEHLLGRGLGKGGKTCCGMTVGLCHTLLELDDEGLSMGRLAEALDLDPSTATRLIEDLVKAGLAERHFSSVDRRAVLVRRSLEGARKAADIDEAWNGFLARVLSTMSPEQQTALSSSLPFFLSALRRELDRSSEKACAC